MKIGLETTKLKTFLIFLFIISCGCYCAAQKSNYTILKLNKILINKGEFKDYYRYELGDFYIYNGKYNDVKRFKIQNKKTHKIIYTYKDSLSDAMLLKPKFFSTSIPSDPIIIMIEDATEFSCGQEIILIKNNKIYNPGYINYAVANENGLSIADYCHFTIENNSIVMTFDKVPIINWDKEDKTIDGDKLIFEITETKIKCNIK